jgi:hypothetical protein
MSPFQYQTRQTSIVLARYRNKKFTPGEIVGMHLFAPFILPFEKGWLRENFFIGHVRSSNADKEAEGRKYRKSPPYPFFQRGNQATHSHHCTRLNHGHLNFQQNDPFRITKLQINA